MTVTTSVEALVNLSEEEVKVRRSLQNIFPPAKIERTASSDDTIILKAHGDGLEFLSTLRNLIKQERIRSAARSILLSRARGRRIEFYLNKQAAFVSRVSFCEPVGESPLGPIAVEIEAADLQMVIDYLASTPGHEVYGKGHDFT